MKLKVFYATDGDCLLLTSGDGHHMLVDGGRSGTFDTLTNPVLQELQAAGETIDLVVVSHIDADHISGILSLMKAVGAWAVFDFQIEGGNQGFPRPRQPRPPHIRGVWHNSWRAQLADLAEPIENLVGRVSAGLELVPFDESTESVPATRSITAIRDLAESIPEGVELIRLVDDDTPIPRNAPFGKLVLLRDPPHIQQLGTAAVTVLGPAKKHLEKLRGEWRTWLGRQTGPGNAGAPPVNGVPPDGQGHALGAGGTEFADALAAIAQSAGNLISSITAAAEVIATTDPSRVTPPNRASITLLAEEDNRTCLLTGDAAEEEILEGLTAAGRLDNGPFRCNVVKVQHHGSEANLSAVFAGAVLADQYVFSADGAHRNPDPSVVKTIIETRLAADPSPFTLWFNCSEQRTLLNRRPALRAAIEEATRGAADHPGVVTVRVLEDADPFLDIEV